MSFKRHRISSASNLFEPYILVVNKDGYVEDIEGNKINGIVIGSKYESLKQFWLKFEGEDSYVIDENIE